MPDVEVNALADEIIELCGGDLDLAERVTIRTGAFRFNSRSLAEFFAQEGVRAHNCRFEYCAALPGNLQSARMNAPDPVTERRLAGRPLYRGQRVPAVVGWGGRWSVKSDPEWGVVNDCDCSPGSGTPDLGAFCARQHFQVMKNRLCNICGQEFGPGETFWFVSWFVSWHREPPFHAGCGVYAFQMCPELRDERRRAPVHLQIIGCTSFRLAATVLSRNGFLTPEQARQESTIMNPVVWLYAAPEEPTIVLDVPTWLDRVRSS